MTAAELRKAEATKPADTKETAMTATSIYLDEVVSFGGIPTKRGDVISELQRIGGSQATIDRYLQGLDLSRKGRK